MFQKMIHNLFFILNEIIFYIYQGESADARIFIV